MSAPPTNMIRTVEIVWTRRPHSLREIAVAGPRDAPKNDSMKTSSPMVTPKIKNALSPVKNPPAAVAKTATAARNGPVQPTPTATNPTPNR